VCRGGPVSRASRFKYADMIVRLIVLDVVTVAVGHVHNEDLADVRQPHRVGRRADYPGGIKLPCLAGSLSSSKTSSGDAATVTVALVTPLITTQPSINQPRRRRFALARAQRHDWASADLAGCAEHAGKSAPTRALLLDFTVRLPATGRVHTRPRIAEALPRRPDQPGSTMSG
jgi:hypothetical protein